jgi:hypothetical protein
VIKSEILKPIILEYKYDIVIEEAMLLVGKNLDVAEDIPEDVPGYHINLQKYEIWSDGDIVKADCVTITSTTDEKQAIYLKDVIRETAKFALTFENKISQTQAIAKFLKH